MAEKWFFNPAVRLLMNRAFIALLGAASGMLFAAFPLQMSAFCGGA